MALNVNLRAAQVCSLVFDECPGAFASQTVTVPSHVIWLDQKIPVCAANIPIRASSAAPSLVFVIDNSSSMSKGDVDDASGGNDPDEARFRVVRDMLDTISRNSPDAEVGLVIFSRRLQFDDRDNPYFRRALADTAQHDAFIPLTPLNKDFGGGVSGLDTLKALLRYTGNGNLAYATRYPDSRANSRYTPDNLRDGTDITLGFEAAKAALSGSRSAKEDRFIIFLSDGEPQNVDTTRVAFINDFRSGRDVPTTYTVFFKGNTDNPKVPKTIQAMTDSIRANGYSANNPKSAYWAIGQPGVQLDTLLRNRVLNPIFTNTAGKAEKAVLTVGGTPYSTDSVAGNGFAFSRRVPLAADRTTIHLVYTYSYLDSGKAMTREVPYALTVQRAGAGAALAPGLSSACREQGDIALYHQGKPVQVINADQTDLEVRLTLGEGEACEGCVAEVKPSGSADRETLALAPAGGYLKGRFARGIGANPIPGDGKLEHSPSDSIYATYVNPDNPLDVIRKAYPYEDLSTRVSVLPFNEYSRGGLASDGSEPQFILVAPSGLSPSPAEAGGKWDLIPSLAAPGDSLRYLGSIVEASRAFAAEISVYTNLGQFVNRISFVIPQGEFGKLENGASAGTRRLRVLWNNRARDGRPVGTGAYILKTRATLLPLPGNAEGTAGMTRYRKVGVLRAP